MPTMLPPPQYDHPPTIAVIEHVLTSDRVDAICQARHTTGPNGLPPPPGYRFTGCAHVVSGSSCEVWRIDDGTVRRHELAHCNGWPGNHPDHYVAPPEPVAPIAPPPLTRAVKLRTAPIAPAIPDAVFQAISSWPTTKSDDK